MSAEVRGLALGLLGVAIFAVTLPKAPLAVGTPEAPPMAGVVGAMSAPFLYTWDARQGPFDAAVACLADVLIGNEEDFQLCLGFKGPEAGGKDLVSKI